MLRVDRSTFDLEPLESSDWAGEAQLEVEGGLGVQLEQLHLPSSRERSEV